MPDSNNRQPNVIFILTDDQGPWAAGCCGNDEVRTPNIDRLAETGVRFENFFCTSPVCSPARASLMTGRIPSAHGVHDWIRDGNMPPNSARYLEGLTCYTDVLDANGYTVGLSGKWHLGDSMTPQHGFSHWFAMPLGGSKYNDGEMIRDGVVEVQPRLHYRCHHGRRLYSLLRQTKICRSISVSTTTHPTHRSMDTRRILWILTTIVHSKRAPKRRHTRGQFPVLVYIWATGSR